MQDRFSPGDLAFSKSTFDVTLWKDTNDSNCSPVNQAGSVSGRDALLVIAVIERTRSAVRDWLSWEVLVVSSKGIVGWLNAQWITR